MSDRTELSAWVARAEEDYALARSALRRRLPLVYGACFHAQQCAEKYLKAVLIARGRPFPRTHDLVVLSDLCAQAGLASTMATDELDLLSSYAVRVRYPGEQPTAEEARSAVKIARQVRQLARRALNLD
jgi:HEPN domain-containing protein